MRYFACDVKQQCEVATLSRLHRLTCTETIQSEGHITRTATPPGELHITHLRWGVYWPWLLEREWGTSRRYKLARYLSRMLRGTCFSSHSWKATMLWRARIAPA